MRPSLRSLSAVLALLLGTVALLVPGAASARTQTQPKITLVIKVAGCKGCTISLRHGMWIASEDYGDSFYRQAKVKDGKVAFQIAPANARDLVVSVADPGSVNTNALTAAVLRYRNQQPGQTITARQAKASKRGYACSAQLKRSKVTWALKIARFPAREFITNKAGYSFAAYMSPGVSTVGTPTSGLWHGQMGYQDGPFCDAR